MSKNSSHKNLNNKIQSFDRFGPRAYLEEYYGKDGEKIGFENDCLLRFYSQIYSGIGDIKLDKEKTLLEFGGGPTIYSLISVAPGIKEIHFADYLNDNLNEILIWKENKANAFNWSRYISRALQHEGIVPTKESIKSREHVIRKKINTFLACNAYLPDPLGPKYRKEYHIVSMNFVAESITSDYENWYKILENVVSLIRSGGRLVMTALEEAEFYYIGSNKFPAVAIKIKDIIEVFPKLGLVKEELYSIPSEHSIKDVINGEAKYQGYNGIIFYVGRKK